MPLLPQHLLITPPTPTTTRPTILHQDVQLRNTTHNPNNYQRRAVRARAVPSISPSTPTQSNALTQFNIVHFVIYEHSLQTSTFWTQTLPCGNVQTAYADIDPIRHHLEYLDEWQLDGWRPPPNPTTEPEYCAYACTDRSWIGSDDSAYHQRRRLCPAPSEKPDWYVVSLESDDEWHRVLIHRTRTNLRRGG